MIKLHDPSSLIRKNKSKTCHVLVNMGMAIKYCMKEDNSRAIQSVPRKTSSVVIKILKLQFPNIQLYLSIFQIDIKRML